MKNVSKISDARNKNEYNESHVVTAKKVPKVNFNLVIYEKHGTIHKSTCIREKLLNYCLIWKLLTR